MGIWLDRDSRIAVQGLTGRNGQFHARQMLDYGTVSYTHLTLPTKA